jgi:hypothetical protein
MEKYAYWKLAIKNINPILGLLLAIVARVFPHDFFLDLPYKTSPLIF